MWFDAVQSFDDWYHIAVGASRTCRRPYIDVCILCFRSLAYVDLETGGWSTGEEYTSYDAVDS
jgi:hypothetical protein